MHPKINEIVLHFQKLFTEKYGNIISELKTNDQFLYFKILSLNKYIVIYHISQEGIIIEYNKHAYCNFDSKKIITLKDDEILAENDIKRIGHLLLRELDSNFNFWNDISREYQTHKMDIMSNKLDNLEKIMNNLMMMLEYHPDNQNKIDELKDHFMELAKN